MVNMIIKKIDIIPDKISNFRVWKLNQNKANENIVSKLVKSQSQIKNWAEVLNKDYKDNRNTNFKSYFKTKKIKDMN